MNVSKSSSKKRKLTRQITPAGGFSSRVSRPIRSNSIFISRTVDLDLDFASDATKGFGFSPQYLVVNGVLTTLIPGSSTMISMFDLVRIVKVEMTVIPSYDSLDWGNTSAAAVKNLPYFYHAFDANDGTNPSLADMRSNSTTRTDVLNKPIRRTFYPRLLNANSIISETAVRSWSKSDQNNIWYGVKTYADCISTFNSGAFARYSFKITYEAKNVIA